MGKSGGGLAGYLFERTIYNRPHEPTDEEAWERWAKVDELQKGICAAGNKETLGLVVELIHAMEIYHLYEKRAAFVLGFKAGGQAMRDMLEE